MYKSRMRSVAMLLAVALTASASVSVAAVEYTQPSKSTTTSTTPTPTEPVEPTVTFETMESSEAFICPPAEDDGGGEDLERDKKWPCR